VSQKFIAEGRDGNAGPATSLKYASLWMTASFGRLGVVDHPADLDLRAPEAKPDFFIRVQFAQIQLTPAVQAGAAKEILDAVRLVLSMRPQLCY
jgi:hypothetical protein